MWDLIVSVPGHCLSLSYVNFSLFPFLCHDGMFNILSFHFSAFFLTFSTLLLFSLAENKCLHLLEHNNICTCLFSLVLYFRLYYLIIFLYWKKKKKKLQKNTKKQQQQQQKKTKNKKQKSKNKTTTTTNIWTLISYIVFPTNSWRFSFLVFFVNADGWQMGWLGLMENMQFFCESTLHIYTNTVK